MSCDQSTASEHQKRRLFTGLIALQQDNGMSGTQKSHMESESCLSPFSKYLEHVRPVRPVWGCTRTPSWGQGDWTWCSKGGFHNWSAFVFPECRVSFFFYSLDSGGFAFLLVRKSFHSICFDVMYLTYLFLWHLDNSFISQNVLCLFCDTFFSSVFFQR